MPALTKQQVNDLYSGMIAPQGGLYQPGPPVMLPPVGMSGGSNATALGNALLSGDSGQLYDVANDPSMPVSGGFQSGTWANPLKPQLKDAGIPNTPYMAYVTGKDESRLPSETPAQKAIDIVVRGGAPDALRLGQALTGGAWSGMHPVDSMGLPVDSDIPTNSPRYVPRTTGLASIGQPRVTAPAYHQALTAAAQKYGVPAQTIHQQLMQPSDPLQQKVLAAQQQGEVYDRSKDPSFNPNGASAQWKL